MTSHVAARAIYIVSAKRTACGAFGGKLKDLSATDLAVHSTKAALEAINLSPSAVDSIVVGNVRSVVGMPGLLRACIFSVLHIVKKNMFI